MRAASRPLLPSIDEEARRFGREILDFAEGAAADAAPEHRYRLAGSSVALRTRGARFDERLTRALRHAELPAGAAGEHALRIFAVDGQAARAGPPPGWQLPYADRRHLERLHVDAERGFYLTRNDETQTWQVFDREAGRAAIWAPSAATLPDWEDSFPLRTLLNWHLAPSGAALAHAAVVGDGTDGVLLTGAGGAGKSTVTAACLEAGLAMCGDDFVAVTPAPEPRAHALFDTLKLDARALAWFPELAAHVANPERGAAKARIHVLEARPDGLTASCRLRALLVPARRPGAKTGIQPLSRGAALRALAPTTLFLVRGAETETAAKLAALVRRLPAYELCIGGHPAEAAGALRSLLERGDA